MDISVDLTFQLASNVDYEAVEVAWQPDISCNKEQEDSICNEFISAAKKQLVIQQNTNSHMK